MTTDDLTCPRCGGLGGTHDLVHTRYGNGGGGNKPCPNAPTTDDLRTRAEAVAKRVWPDRPDADRITYPHAALQHYRQGAFVQGALWHAAQQPARERSTRTAPSPSAFTRCQIADLICAHVPGCKPGDGFDAADAVLELLNGDKS